MNMHEFISTSKHWHRLLSSLDNLRIISACLTPNLKKFIKRAMMIKTYILYLSICFKNNCDAADISSTVTNTKFTHALHTCSFILRLSLLCPHNISCFMCSPAGAVERSLSIIVPDIRITVSFSHQISHHIQTTIPAVFEKQTFAVHHTVFTNTEMHVNRALYPGSSGEEKTYHHIISNTGNHNFAEQQV